MNNTNQIAAGVDISTALQREPSTQICCEVTKDREKEKSSLVFLATNNTTCTKGGFISYIYISRVKRAQTNTKKRGVLSAELDCLKEYRGCLETKHLSVKHVESVEK